MLGSNVLDLKDRALAIFTVVTALGCTNQAKLYMQGLRNLGYSVRQIAELLETIGLYAGVPRAVEGHALLRELAEEDAERDHAEAFYYEFPRH
jgi:alkylhydroperoxidase/carboxymuconolactone decarboxylase family protein YurZ